jgi:predicted extracellular nuclease/2',3'-cyclic-nucleotide 2'-phosphodiesterase (5'-nucleotidase family)
MAFTLQLLHASDQEAGIPALQDAIGLSAVLNALQGNYENTLKLTSGDLFIAGPFFSASADIYDSATTRQPAGQVGIADVLIQNELGWNAAAVGNHEFDAGDATFFSLLAPNPNWVNGTIGGQGIGPAGYPGALFPYLSNNLNYSAATLPAGLTVVPNGGQPLPNTLTGSVIADVNGTSVGILAAVTPYLPSIANIGRVQMTTGSSITASTPIAQQVDALIANLQPEVQALGNAGINKVVLMTHLQEAEIEQALAQRLADLGLGVDIHIGGGSHRVMSNEATIPPLRLDETQQNAGQLLQPYPQPFTSGANTVYYVNTGANYRYLSQLVANFDDAGVITSIGSESGTYATDIAGVDRLYAEDITTFDQVRAVADPDVVAIVDGVGQLVNELDGTIFGQTSVFLNGIRGDVRTQETNLGNLTADANDFYAEKYLTAYGDALLPGFNQIDVSFKNGGGIRDQIGLSFIPGGGGALVQLPPPANPNVGKEEGDISRLDISNSLRFNNALSVGTMTAAGLYETAEHMVAGVERVAGQFGQIGGFRFSFDPTAPARTSTTPGQRIQNLALFNNDGSIKDIVVQNGRLVGDPNRNFSVVTLSFLATGGDSYPRVLQNVKSLGSFAEPTSLGQANLVAGSEQDALAEYLAATYNTTSGQTPFAQADTPQALDERVQNLTFRADTVLDGSDNGGGTRIFDIQGTAHRSPLEGQIVEAVPGIVTLVRNNGFFMQDPTGDCMDATSDAIFVLTSTRPTVQVGDQVEVSGTVSEFRAGTTTGRNSNLSTTQLTRATVTIVSSNNSLPAPTLIGLEGRTPPTERIAGNAPSNTVEAEDYIFNPSQNGIDFFESLEGMRVQVNGGVVVGPTNDFGEVWVLADNGEGTSSRTPRGGVVIRPDDFNPERIQVQFPQATAPRVNVNDRLSSVIGVVNYDFGNFEVLPTEPVSATAGGLQREVTELTTGGDKLTLASYNIENFSPRSSSIQIANIGRHIAVNLDSPDIIGLQEVQDNNGAPTVPSGQPVPRDGVVDASQSYQVLIDAIVAAGGPTYKFFDIAPEELRDGGQPGGNIRVGYLYNPDRVSLVTRPGGTATSNTTVVDGGLSASPGRLDPTNPSFTSSRKPLAAEFVFNGQRLFTINNHFASKGGSDALFGRFQPPINGGEDQRIGQSEVNREFVEALLASNPNARVAVLGDLNEFQFFPALQVLETTAAGDQVLFNLTNTLPEGERYSYIFEGNSQTLDHILVTQALLNANAEYDGVHINSEFFDQDSDHDPRIARFDLANPSQSVGQTNVIRGSNGDDEIAAGSNQAIFGRDGDDIIGPAPDSIGSNLINGGRGNDLLIARQNDVLEGGAGNDYLSAADGRGGNDLRGGAGDDLLFGGLNDNLNGGADDDVIYAGQGGVNILTGGSGNDQFWIAYNRLPETFNVITDFGRGQDVIGIRSVAGVTSFADLSLVQIGDSTLVQALGQNVALFQGVQARQITSDRVVFA